NERRRQVAECFDGARILKQGRQILDRLLRILNAAALRFEQVAERIAECLESAAKRAARRRGCTTVRELELLQDDRLRFGDAAGLLERADQRELLTGEREALLAERIRRASRLAERSPDGLRRTRDVDPHGGRKVERGLQG